MAPTVSAYIGIGSNLGDPRKQVLSAYRELAAIPSCRLVARSALYASAPMGPKDQPDYINSAAAIETSLAPGKLLSRLQVIEDRHGRVRGPVRWGPRTLDLDLLVYGKLELDTAELTLPHPGLHKRCFVLCPLADLGVDIVVPGLGTVHDLLGRTDCRGIVRLDEGT
ncbi:MAG: 2-amino-4-hydroxy-6-hydroxymethyldihydropteridine diphosphokinase [Pseudomonadota bacterium]|nr:2-amino-4-hydroxy-6-hydroxymethyldihydropteridine diphosphokinase [Pseudomonadota bacterium]